MCRSPVRSSGISPQSAASRRTRHEPRSAGNYRQAPSRATNAPPPAARGSPGVRRAPAAPDVDGGEQEQPHHVDEMPVPGRRLEPEMLLRREVAATRTQVADDQEDRADDNVEAVEAGRHEEGRAVDAAFEGERRV